MNVHSFSRAAGRVQKSAGRSSIRTPLPSANRFRAARTRAWKRGSLSSWYSNQSSSSAKPTSTPAGRPCRVITIGSRSAARRTREKSSLASASGIFFIFLCGIVLLSMFLEPRLRSRLRHDGDDADLAILDVVEHPQLVDAKAVLWMIMIPQPLDAAPALLRGLVLQVQLDRVPNGCS